MKIQLIGSPQIVMQNPVSRHNYFAWPTVTGLQNGKIAVTASGFRIQHLCPFGKAVIAFSDDEGKTYTLPTPVIDTPHGPCALSDGSVLWVGKLKNDAEANADGKPIKACKIHPDGTCEIIGAIDGVHCNGEKQGVWEPHAIQLEDGRIICHIRVHTMNKSSVDGDLFTVYQSVSEDGGRTWTKPEPVLVPKDGAPAHIIKHSSGTLISLYGRRAMPFGIKAMFSKDNGKTWDINNDIYVNEINPDLGSCRPLKRQTAPCFPYSMPVPPRTILPW